MNIKEICHLRSGTSFPKKPEHSHQGDYWVMDSNCVVSSGAINSNNMLHVSSSDLSKPTTPLQNNDILIRAKGMHYQAILFQMERDKSAVYPTSYFLILSVNQPQEVLPNFLTWLLNQPVNQKVISSFAGGATVKHLTKKRLAQLDIEVPDLAKQHKILELDRLLREEHCLLSEITELRTEYYSAVMSNYLGGTV
jgi:restriction endonuclease S subunit